MLFLYIAPFYDSEPDKQPFAATRLTLSSASVPSGNCDFFHVLSAVTVSEKHPTDSWCLSECGWWVQLHDTALICLVTCQVDLAEGSEFGGWKAQRMRN